MLYSIHETEISRSNLSTVATNVPSPLCILGGWAVFLLTNENFKKRHGNEYHGSKDIDLGFYFNKREDEKSLKESLFNKSITALKQIGFNPQGFRMVQIYHSETKRPLTEDESRRIPSYNLFHLYVDLIVNRIPEKIQDILGIQPADEPMITKIFEKQLYKTITAFGVDILLPNPEVLLATKLSWVLKRTKDHKKIKDIADIYALIWYTDIDIDQLKKSVASLISQDSINKTISSFTQTELEDVSNAIDVDIEQIKSVLNSFISEPTLKVMSSQDLAGRKKRRIPPGVRSNKLANKQKEVSQKIKKDIPVKSKKKRGRRPSSEPTFPKHPLKKSLKVIEAMEENYAGDPTSPSDIADLLGTTLNSSSFVYLLASSHRYDLTKGSYRSEKIEMTQLGKSIVEFTSDEQKNQGLANALLRPELFKNFLQKYDRKVFPREQIIKNVLKNEFNVPNDRLDNCASVIIDNIKDFELIDEANILQLSRLNTQETNLDTESIEDENPDTPEKDVETDHEEEKSEKKEVKMIPKVFISHSKNENILDQLKTILEFGGFEYTVAEEVETLAIPIPDKIFDFMRGCNCAIINVSADKEMKQEDGSYKINENVLIEIGAAFVHYNKRVILLVDKRLELPSNLQGLYRCEYEGDELSFMVAIKLQKALTEFKKSL